MFENQIVLVGTTLVEPELRSTRDGRPVANFRIAVPTGREGPDGTRTTFVDVACWGALATQAAEHLRQGERIVLVGRVERQSWVSRTGERRQKLQVVASELALCLSELAEEEHLPEPVVASTSPVAPEPPPPGPVPEMAAPAVAPGGGVMASGAPGTSAAAPGVGAASEPAPSPETAGNEAGAGGSPEQASESEAPLATS